MLYDADLLQAFNATPSIENSFEAIDDGKWMCRLCCVILKTKQGMQGHFKTVHLKEKNYPCRFCQKRFGYSSDARKHERKCPQKPADMH